MAGPKVDRLAAASCLLLRRRNFEETESVPACPCNLGCDRTQRAITPTLILKAAVQHGDACLDPLECPAQDSSRWRQARIALAPRLSFEECLGRLDPKIGIVCDLSRALPRSLGKISLRESLQPPGDPSKQKLPVR